MTTVEEAFEEVKSHIRHVELIQGFHDDLLASVRMTMQAVLDEAILLIIEDLAPCIVTERFRSLPNGWGKRGSELRDRIVTLKVR